VFGWNASVSLVCGNTQIFKGAPTSSLVAVASQKIVTQVLQKHGLGEVATLCQGGADIGEKM
jgi:aldehyde dehydrogenase family 7 member A1